MTTRTTRKPASRRLRSAHGSLLPWPRRHEREGGLRPGGYAAPTDRLPVPAPMPHPGVIPQQRSAPEPGTGPVRGLRPPNPRDEMARALLASVPPFGSPPYGRRHPGPPRLPAPVPVAAPRNGVGVAALCLALIGLGAAVAGPCLVLVAPPLGAVVPVGALVTGLGVLAVGAGALAVLFGLIGRARVRRDVATNPRTSVAGAALGALALALGVAGGLFPSAALDAATELGRLLPSAAIVATAPATAGIGTAGGPG